MSFLLWSRGWRLNEFLILSRVHECSTEVFFGPLTAIFLKFIPSLKLIFSRSSYEVKYSEGLPACLASFTCPIEPGELPGSETLHAFHRLPEVGECTATGPLGKTRKIQTDKANKWQLHTLIMLIKRRTEHHCDVMANQDLSVNEEYNMIMDRDKESSDHLSLLMVLARTFRHRHQHFTSPWGLLAQKTVQGFMVAEMVWCFSLSWASCYQTETLFRLNFL